MVSNHPPPEEPIVHYPASPLIGITLAEDIAGERRDAASRHRATRRPSRFAGLRRRAAGRRSAPAVPAVIH
jgi:hypothetical protein